jgi:hypothetical protein
MPRVLYQSPGAMKTRLALAGIVIGDVVFGARRNVCGVPASGRPKLMIPGYVHEIGSKPHSDVMDTRCGDGFRVSGSAPDVLI